MRDAVERRKTYALLEMVVFAAVVGLLWYLVFDITGAFRWDICIPVEQRIDPPKAVPLVKPEPIGINLAKALRALGNSSGRWQGNELDEATSE